MSGGLSLRQPKPACKPLIPKDRPSERERRVPHTRATLSNLAAIRCDLTAINQGVSATPMWRRNCYERIRFSPELGGKVSLRRASGK
jgi:hypothetical protein